VRSEAHAEMLKQFAPDPFTVLHRIDADVLELKEN
jgi:hypothetical protein